MTIQELRKRSNEFVSNINSNVKAAVMANEKEIIAMNQEQMRIGKTSKGNKIGRLRDLFYAREKINKGGLAPFGDVDLFNTGAFQSKMMLSTDGSSYYEIGSTDSKEADLAGRYGWDIFGLMKTFQEDAQRLTSKSLADIYKDKVLR